MRVFLAGIIILLLASAAQAGVIGKVDAFGFGSSMRGDCWTPVRLEINSDSAGPEEYQLQVVQTDLDGDDAIYARPITVNPGRSYFWTYFKPQSFGGGIPRGSLGTSQDLSRVLRIFLATPDGSKRIVQLNVSSAAPSMLEEQDRAGEKLIVSVGRLPNVVREFSSQPVQGGLRAVNGMPEDAFFCGVEIRKLPDNVLGYDSVDAIVWTDANATELDSLQFRAIREYVTGGGTLVILQSAEVGLSERFADMLPVRVGKIETTNAIEPIRTILHGAMPPPPVDSNTGRRVDPWDGIVGPFRIARSTPNADAYVAQWTFWPDSEPTPYIARHVVGAGSVIWVAQDVSDPTIRGVAYGWPNFWARVFDWPIGHPTAKGESQAYSYDYLQNPPPSLIRNFSDIDKLRSIWQSSGAKDIGKSYTGRLDLDSKTAALLSVAFLFFIVYWAIAGPGTYVVLAAKKRTQLSWFVFGLTAVIAVVFTVGVAQLVLRGGAQMRHVTLVRVASGSGQPAHVQSRLGIYLPQDRSDTEVALTGFKNSGPTIITPFTPHPRLSTTNQPNLRDTRYTVNIRNEDDVDKVMTAVPFRSTLKKLQAEWTGDLEGGVSGVVRTTGDERTPELAGNATNNSGRDLSHVLFVFRSENPLSPYRMLYQRLWSAGQTIDLAQAIANADKRDSDGILRPDRDKGTFGYLRDATRWMYQGYPSSIIMPDRVGEDDSGRGYRQSFYIASLFGILPPMENVDRNVSRVEVMRRGVRDWDVSNAAAAGRLVILATANSDQLPIPLTVDGDKPEGTGTTFWQFILPLDRTATTKPPATQQNKDVDVEK